MIKVKLNCNYTSSRVRFEELMEYVDGNIPDKLYYDYEDMDAWFKLDDDSQLVDVLDNIQFIFRNDHDVCDSCYVTIDPDVRGTVFKVVWV